MFANWFQVDFSIHFNLNEQARDAKLKLHLPDVSSSRNVQKVIDFEQSRAVESCGGNGRTPDVWQVFAINTGY